MPVASWCQSGNFSGDCLNAEVSISTGFVLQFVFGQGVLEVQFREAVKVVVGAVQAGVVFDRNGGKLGSEVLG